MSFNPDKSKQMQEVLFPRKNKLGTHPLRLFNNFKVKLASAQNHLGLNIDGDLLLNEHIIDKIN